ncbi:MAG: lysophospholipid acyltransferase family protein [Gordonia sp. (in: high G+C Gram-positive bacteria)]|uniref:lysophospholipid acyltransferase family protein n=1 Tax=Gordonia sp. (in: high G+C Gram-positive bacteria) TaxID=84139 RepID=UPI0039E6C693
MPVSSCGAHCIPAESDSVGALRVALRYAGLVTMLLTVVPLGALTVLGGRRIRIGYWRGAARWGLKMMGVRFEVVDHRPDHARRVRGALIVANHISFLDILAIAAVSPARFVAKREIVAGAGRVLKAFGVLPHHRGALRELRPLLDQVTGIVDRGRPVAVFPEGTTWCGYGYGRFRPAFFQTALDAGVPVLPMRVSYHRGGRTLTSPGFIGGDEIGDTLHRVVRARGVCLTLTVHAPELPVGSRGELAARCQRLVFAKPVAVPAPAPRARVEVQGLRSA